MPRPHEYPITMIDHRGKEYDVHEPGSYVASVFKLGHKRKPVAKPAPGAPAVAQEAKPPTVAVAEAPKPVVVPAAQVTKS